MRHILLICIILLLPETMFANIKEIIAEGTYNMGDGETPTVAEDRALLQAKKTALEQAGTYVESYTRVKNMQLSEDEIQVMSSGLMQVETLDKKRTIVGDGFHFWIKIKATVNPDEIVEMANKVKAKTTIADYKKIQDAYAKSQKEIEELKKELVATKDKEGKKKVEIRISDDEKLFQANEWFEKGFKYTLSFDNERAIEAYTKAIALNPNRAEIYNYRAIARFNRGLHSNDKNQFDLAVEDFEKVVALNPGTYEAYFAQGSAFMAKKRYREAIEQFDKAISIDPDTDMAYINRGFSFMEEEQDEKALKDFNKAIDIGQSWRVIAYGNRSVIFSKRKQYAMAIEDLNQAIALAPNNSIYYLARGAAYYLSGTKRQGISDVQAACDMQNDKACKFLSSIK